MNESKRAINMAEKDISDKIAASGLFIVAITGLALIAPAFEGVSILKKRYMDYLSDENQKSIIRKYWKYSLALLILWCILVVLSMSYYHLRDAPEFQLLIRIYAFGVFVASIIIPIYFYRKVPIDVYANIAKTLETSNIRQKNLNLVKYALLYNISIIILTSVSLLLFLIYFCVVQPFIFCNYGYGGLCELNPACQFIGYVLQFLFLLVKSVTGSG